MVVTGIDEFGFLDAAKDQCREGNRERGAAAQKRR